MSASDANPDEPLSAEAIEQELAAVQAQQQEHELGEDDIPPFVLYLVGGLILVAIAAYIIVGGGHNHFH